MSSVLIDRQNLANLNLRLRPLLRPLDPLKPHAARLQSRYNRRRMLLRYPSHFQPSPRRHNQMHLRTHRGDLGADLVGEDRREIGRAEFKFEVEFHKTDCGKSLCSAPSSRRPAAVLPTRTIV